MQRAISGDTNKTQHNAGFPVHQKAKRRVILEQVKCSALMTTAAVCCLGDAEARWVNAVKRYTRTCVGSEVVASLTGAWSDAKDSINRKRQAESQEFGCNSQTQLQ
jgi:hypothetical protein